MSGVRDDKLLAPEEVRAFLDTDLVVEEKIDGANLGLSFDSASRLRFQNRGLWLEEKLTGQWERLRGWAAEHETALREHLPPGHILFGEWCYAQHSIRYEHLPDWFIGFDVYDASAERFWSTGRRDALLMAMNLAGTPVIGRGTLTLGTLRELHDGISAFGQSKREGLCLRREDEAWPLKRAKLASPNFNPGDWRTLVAPRDRAESGGAPAFQCGGRKSGMRKSTTTERMILRLTAAEDQDEEHHAASEQGGAEHDGARGLGRRGGDLARAAGGGGGFREAGGDQPEAERDDSHGDDAEDGAHHRLGSVALW